MDPRALQLIVLAARQAGVDPEAALRVASAEGGIKFGAVGDHGTSFGPFQLHVGGALPKGKDAAWANSAEGIKYALQQMAASGAKGKTGRDAVASIVQNFERPAAPGAEIERALGASIPGYKGVKGSLPNTPTSAIGAASDLSTALSGGGDPKQALLGLLSQRQTALSQGQDVNPLQFLQGLQSLGGGTPQAPKGSLDPGGSLAPPRSGTPATHTSSALVNLASQQLGQKYVWGGESRKEGGFDCSGLVDWSMRQQGYTGPRLTTYSIAKMGQSVKGQQMKPGDLILANNNEHVVIYAGDGKVIAAPHTGTVVQYQPVSKFNITDVRRV